MNKTRINLRKYTNWSPLRQAIRSITPCDFHRDLYPSRQFSSFFFILYHNPNFFIILEIMIPTSVSFSHSRRASLTFFFVITLSVTSFGSPQEPHNIISISVVLFHSFSFPVIFNQPLRSIRSAHSGLSLCL